MAVHLVHNKLIMNKLIMNMLHLFTKLKLIYAYHFNSSINSLIFYPRYFKNSLYFSHLKFVSKPTCKFIFSKEQLLVLTHLNATALFIIQNGMGINFYNYKSLHSGGILLFILH